LSFSIVNKKELRKIIEPHFYEGLISDEYKLETINATQLLTYNRFDLSFKLLFLKMTRLGVKFSQDAYKEHIRALSLGSFKEPGNLKKSNFNDYLKAFEDIFADIKKDGFNKEKSVIPLSSNGYITNGSHRLACSIILNIQVDCVHLDGPDHVYDYKFFYERGVPKNMMDAAACEFIENSKNVFIAIIWPTAVGEDKKINHIIKNIVYEKQVKLNSNGAHNLLSQIYYGEKWIGSVEDDFIGSYGKLIECFKTFDKIRFIAFQSSGIEEVIRIKEKIRGIFNIGKHSIHISDNQKESLRIARIAFNENSIHFLNYAKPNKFISTHNKIKQFKKFILKNNINSNDVLLDSSITLSAYGLREARDTDFLCSNNEKMQYAFDLINPHDEVLKYYSENKFEIIYNHSYYFYFNDLKFISFPKLYQMKVNRNEIKDQNDIKLMALITDGAYVRKFSARLIQYFFYGKIKARRKLMIFLKLIGLYKGLKYIFKSLLK
tara:strand:+ start:3036 stop:4508 length:1473 start_codon:yes stop_codon:yes gene_type:complete